MWDPNQWFRACDPFAFKKIGCWPQPGGGASQAEQRGQSRRIRDLSRRLARGSGSFWKMARKLRVQYPGAIYHVMSRGNRRERIFVDDQDRRKFLQTLSEACQKTGWQVHAYPWSSYGEYLKAPRQRSRWVRVDRLLGEMRIPRDSAAGGREFERPRPP